MRNNFRPKMLVLVWVFAIAAANTWGASVNTASMATARNAHTATLLSNGKVLVAGGYNGSALASAELYDPATKTWSTAGSLSTARWGHAATLLATGNVLVVGGYNKSALASAELYDPAKNTWSSAGNLSTARYNSTVTLMYTGSVLVAGGIGGVTPLASAEVYDPLKNTWSVTSSMATARTSHLAVQLPSPGGMVLVSGGVGFGSTSSLASVELFDPAAKTWSTAAPMSVARSSHTATLLNTGKVLVSGGYNGNVLASAELYDPTLNVWSTAAQMAAARRYHSATPLANGTVLVAGGVGSGGPFVGAELYDPAADAWSTAGTLITARGYHTATLLLPILPATSGMVLIAGGYNSNTGYLSSAELYDPSNSESAITSISMQVKPSPAKVGQTVTAFAAATSSTADVIIYSWDFGDGTDFVLGANATHVYTDNGTYDVTLTITSGGATDTRIVSLLVFPDKTGSSLTFKDSLKIKDALGKGKIPMAVASSNVSIAAKIFLPPKTILTNNDTLDIKVGTYLFSETLGNASKFKSKESYTFNLTDRVSNTGKIVKTGLILVSLSKDVVTITATLNGSSTYDRGTLNIVTNNVLGGGGTGTLSGLTTGEITIGSVTAQFTPAYTGKTGFKVSKKGVSVGSYSVSGSDVYAVAQ